MSRGINLVRLLSACQRIMQTQKKRFSSQLESDLLLYHVSSVLNLGVGRGLCVCEKVC